MSSINKGAALLLGLPPVGGKGLRRASIGGMGVLKSFVEDAFGSGLTSVTRVAAIPRGSTRNGGTSLLEMSSCRGIFEGGTKSERLAVRLR